MKRSAIVLALVLSVFATGLAGAADLPTAKPEQVGLSSEHLERIGQVLRADVEKVVVSMQQSPLGRHYYPLVRALVYQAIAE